MSMSNAQEASHASIKKSFKKNISSQKKFSKNKTSQITGIHSLFLQNHKRMHSEHLRKWIDDDFLQFSARSFYEIDPCFLESNEERKLRDEEDRSLGNYRH